MPKVSVPSETVEEEILDYDTPDTIIEPDDEDDDFEFEEEETMQVEDLDPNEEIWPNGPTAGQIVQWKEQFGDVFVSSFSPEYHVVWRTMNRFEYRHHIRQMEQAAGSGQFSQGEAALINEESICETCVLYPPFSRDKLPTEMAGVPSSLSQDILEASGFVALEVRKL